MLPGSELSEISCIERKCHKLSLGMLQLYFTDEEVGGTYLWPFFLSEVQEIDARFCQKKESTSCNICHEA
jgi:hypothetical protein